MQQEADYSAAMLDAVDTPLIVVCRGVVEFTNRAAQRLHHDVEVVGKPLASLVDGPTRRLVLHWLAHPQPFNVIASYNVADSVRPKPLRVSAAEIIWQGESAWLITAQELDSTNMHEHDLPKPDVRSQLARSVHDGMSQTLFSARIIAESLPILYDQGSDAVRANLLELAKLTQGALAEVQTLLLELNPQRMRATPLDELLEHLARSLSSHTPAAVDFSINSVPFKLPSKVKTNLYRLAQESLKNAIRYAQAEHIALHLWVEDKNVYLKVWSDRHNDQLSAVGAQTGFHQVVAQAKAAAIDVQVESAPLSGTSILATWRRLARKHSRKT